MFTEQRQDGSGLAKGSQGAESGGYGARIAALYADWVRRGQPQASAPGWRRPSSAATRLREIQYGFVRSRTRRG